MKNSLILCLTIAVAMLVCPAAALGGNGAAPQEDKPAAAAAELSKQYRRLQVKNAHS